MGGKNANQGQAVLEISDQHPKDVREAQKWEAGQSFVFLAKGKGVILMPAQDLADLRGLARLQHTGLSRPQRSHMSMVVDTSAWIEWLAGSKSGDRLLQYWPTLAETIVPTLVQLELASG